MQNRSFQFFLLSLLILNACSSIQPSDAHETQISLVDGLGREVNLASPAQHIVSLAPSNTEILYAIGAGNQIVARDDFSNYPEAALSLPAIGGFMGDYDYEAILAMKPDLVLASTLNTSGQIQSLEDLGITVYLLSNPVELEGLYENLLIVGQLTGHEANAASLNEFLKIRVYKVAEKLATISQEPLVYYELDGSEPAKPWTPGPNTFLTKLIDMAGGTSVGEILESDYAQISLEELLIQDPDMIILGDSNYGVTADQVAERAGWSGLTAVQSQAIYPFNDDLVSRPGPRLVDGLEALAQLLHPELFK
jgi:iron complex transport system substrate-binding protein